MIIKTICNIKSVRNSNCENIFHTFCSHSYIITETIAAYARRIDVIDVN